MLFSSTLSPKAFFFFFFSLLFCLSHALSSLFSLSLSPPLAATRVQGHQKGSSPPFPIHVWHVLFIATGRQPFLPSSTRIESRLPTLQGALSSIDSNWLLPLLRVFSYKCAHMKSNRSFVHTYNTQNTIPIHAYITSYHRLDICVLPYTKKTSYIASCRVQC